jgi:hypothetical protein
LLRYFRRLKEGASNSIKWFPVIVTDRQWDYNFLYKVLHKKLSLMEEFYRSDQTHIADWETVADEIKDVKEALNRLIKSEYLTEETVQYDEKYGDEELFAFEKIKGKNASKLVWTDDEIQRKEFREAGNRAEKRESDDIEFVFSNLSKNIRKWWD